MSCVFATDVTTAITARGGTAAKGKRELHGAVLLGGGGRVLGERREGGRPERNWGVTRGVFVGWSSVRVAGRGKAPVSPGGPSACSEAGFSRLLMGTRSAPRELT